MRSTCSACVAASCFAFSCDTFCSNKTFFCLRAIGKRKGKTTVGERHRMFLFQRKGSLRER